MDNETTDQFVITVTSKDDTSLTAKVTVNVAHPINILHCDADKHFNLGQTHQLFIDEGELKNSSLNGKYQIKDFVWHMEVESVSSTGATEHKGDISFRMGDDGKLIYTRRAMVSLMEYLSLVQMRLQEKQEHKVS